MKRFSYSAYDYNTYGDNNEEIGRRKSVFLSSILLKIRIGKIIHFNGKVSILFLKSVDTLKIERRVRFFSLVYSAIE